ncbi:hypothetical protein FWD20_01740 [Candidatus Saccharibacteria bacterium]|nr:hypothetical protein [Candidatus Saccharibacteria bacterium]
MNSIILGTHQKIDRIARRKLQPFIPHGVKFPSSREMLRFEGQHGPDSIRLKTTGDCEDPKHFIDPDDPSDRDLLDMIAAHEKNLIHSLREDAREKAAFEAAWLAHAIVDGLTPAHHYPYEEKLAELRGGQKDQLRNTKRKRVFVPGDGLREKVKNNVAFLGPNGLWMKHWQFETGVDLVARPLRFSDVKLSRNDRARIREAGGIVPLYLDIVQRIYRLNMYEEFLKKSWTRNLARQTKDKLMPTIIHTVLLSWYYCAWRAAQE